MFKTTATASRLRKRRATSSPWGAHGRKRAQRPKMAASFTARKGKAASKHSRSARLSPGFPAQTVSDFLSPARYQISRRSKSPMSFRQHRRAALSRYQTCRKIFKFEVMYGSASHPAIINGKDSRKGRRGSRFQLKYRKQPHAK